MSPTYRFVAEVPAGELDLNLTLQSGQVFRWKRLEGGGWEGVDGDAWFQIVPETSQREIDVISRATGMNRDESLDALQARAEVAADDGIVDRFAVSSNLPEHGFRDYFRLELSHSEVVREIVSRGPELAPYLSAMKGLRLVRTRDPVESFFSFLCTPNNNLPRIVGMVQHLATYGEAADGFHRFPTVAMLTAIDPAALRARAFGYRANTIPTAARYVLEQGGDEWVHCLQKLPYEEASAALRGVPYVGRKLADCIALHALHLPDVAPIDTHLWQAAVRIYFPEWRDSNLTDLKYRQLGSFLRERFGVWTGWAQQALFLDNVLNWRSRQAVGG